MKKILILGGTNFIGRNLVERLLAMNEFDITLFNRQVTRPDLFPSVNKIKGNRETDEIDQIGQQKWDYVIDLSCYYPAALKSVIDCLPILNKYIFISTCSVYDNESGQEVLRDENSGTLACTTDQSKNRDTETYGNRKAECERILMRSGLLFVILRPALVYGKYDPTDRLYYWLYQVKKNDTLLLPENDQRLFSTTYVFDLVETVIQAIRQPEISGVYNVITNPETSIGQIVDLSRNILKRNVSLFNAPAEFLEGNDISQWTDMPLWIHGDHFTYSNRKLKNELGLQLTDFEKSLGGTIKYYDNMEWPEPRYGISESRRQELIGLMDGLSNLG